MEITLDTESGEYVGVIRTKRPQRMFDGSYSAPILASASGATASEATDATLDRYYHYLTITPHSLQWE